MNRKRLPSATSLPCPITRAPSMLGASHLQPGDSPMAKRTKLGKPPSQRGNRLQREQPPDDSEDDDIRFIATHEAGHAVSASVLGMNLFKVDIKRRRMPDGSMSLGFT